MEKKPSWDDIPSLEGLDVEWEFKPENSLGKRSFVRINAEDISGLFEVKAIPVKIATAREAHTGQLLGISRGGFSLSLPAPLEENIPVKAGFFLGTMKIIAKGLVKHCRKTGEWHTAGIEFVDLNEECAAYIAELYASKVFHHSS